MEAWRLRSTMNRRDFIKTVAFAAGAVLVPPLESSATPPIKIGVLYPRSTIYPDLGFSHLSGMRLCFEQSDCQAGGRPIQLIPKETGPGFNAVLRKSAELIQEGVDLAVGVVGSRVAPMLRDLFHEAKTFFMVNTIGANLPPDAVTRPFIFYNSLNLWQASWALGYWTARNLGHRAIIVTSFYDSGYDAPIAFRLGFEQAGGNIVQNLVTGAPASPVMTVKGVLEKIAKVGPDVVFGSYCGQSAVNFVRAYAASALAGRIPLVGSGFMVAESILPIQGPAALGIKSSLCWAGSLETAENRTYTAAFQQRTKRPADAFAVLGYDTARLLVTALNTVGGNGTTVESMTRVLNGAEISSPRGMLKVHPQMQSIWSPVYIREVRQKENQLQNDVIDRLEPPPGLHKIFHETFAGLRSGWLDPYLAV